MIIIPSFYPAVIYGGPIFSSYNACKALVDLDKVDILVASTNANSSKRLNVETNKWTYFEDRFQVKYYNETIIGKLSIPLILGVWKDIRAARVVHIQSVFSISTPISLFYSFLFGKKTFLSPRGQLGYWPLNNGSKFKSLWLNFLIKPFTKMIHWHATSNQEKEEIEAIFLNPKISIIPNGIDLREFRISDKLIGATFYQSYNKIDCNNKKVLVSMGRLQKKKGFDILIKAFKQMNREDILLFIAGPDEGEKKNLLTIINSLELSEKVFLIGSISGQEKLDFLANADLFVLPSHNENFGNVYLESLAMGTPIIASTDTPWAEVVDFNCGLWVDNSVKEIKNAIDEMLTNDRILMRKNAISFASKYDWSNIAKQFYDAYKN